MDTERKKDEESIYHAAAALPITERADYLREACKGNPTLLRRLKVLLASRDEAGEFLERPALDGQAALDTLITEQPGAVIGRYKLLEKIG